MDIHHHKFVATRDHCDPRSRGGADVQSNIARACAMCNQDKRDLTVVEFYFALKEAGDPRAKHVAKFIASRQPVKTEEPA